MAIRGPHPDASVTSILEVSLSELVKIQMARALAYNFSIMSISPQAKTNILHKASVNF